MSETGQSFWTCQFHVFGGFRRLVSPRMLRRYLFYLACLATIVALYYGEEDWRGRHAWESYMRQSKAKGIDLDWRANIPPPVPDEQNFAMIPMFKALFDYKWMPDGELHWPDTNWVEREGIFSVDLSNEHAPDVGAWEQGRPVGLKEWQVYFRGTNFPPNDAPARLIKKFGRNGTIQWPIAAMPQEPAADILLALGRFDSKLGKLRQASARPYSQFPLHYDEHAHTLLAHLGVLVHACKVLQLRAIAELDTGRSDAALGDVRLAVYCADAVKSEPFMVSQLVRSRMITENLQPVWEGLRAHQWPEHDLAEIQRMLSGIDLLSDYERVLKSESAFLAGWIERIPGDPQEFFFLRESYGFPEQIVGWLPRGWYYQNELSEARFFQEKMLADVVPQTQQAFPSRSLTNAMMFDTLPNTLNTFVFRQIGTVYSPQNLLQAQTGVNLARIACGLERWRMGHAHFPETLAALVPDDLDKLPHDIINGEPLKYRIRSDGQFILYSVGWNEQDDDGIYPKVGAPLPSGANGIQDSVKEYRSETGDWVWQYPRTN